MFTRRDREPGAFSRVGVGRKNGFFFVFNSNEMYEKYVDANAPGHARLLSAAEALTKFPLAFHEPGSTAAVRPSIQSIDLKVYNAYAEDLANLYNNDKFLVFHVAVQPIITEAKENTRHLSIQERNCRFADETDDLVLFNHYTESNCLLVTF